MSQLTSTLIDDEQLIEELRRYGEKNLPTLGASSSGTSSRSKSNKNQLNDTNREIFLKKLNHYRAREKAESNPSKQYLKQQNLTLNQTNQSRHSLGNTNTKQDYDYNEDEDDDDDVKEIEPDIIQLDSNETQYEYIKVSNAFTSPLSNKTQNNISTYDDYNNQNESMPSSPPPPVYTSTQLPAFANSNILPHLQSQNFA